MRSFVWIFGGVSQNYGYHLGGPIIRIIIFWGVYWGPRSPYFGKLPFRVQVFELSKRGIKG